MAYKFTPINFNVYDASKTFEENVQRNAVLTKENLDQFQDIIRKASADWTVGTVELQDGEGEPKVELVFNELEGTRKFNFVIPAGKNGTDGKDGKNFKISKTYESVEAMNAAYASDGLEEGDIVAIAGDVQEPENAQLYVKGSSKYEFLVDMSGATGIEGQEGKEGKQGEKGEAATIEIESVTTGDVANVVNNGDEQHARLAITLPNGAVGPEGKEGKSAFEVWKAQDGNAAKEESDFFDFLKGEQGKEGEQGPEGKSAFQVWQGLDDNGSKSEQDFFASLKGDKGDDGNEGPQGKEGLQGPEGKAATVKIGNVTTGEVPSVTNTAESETDVVLDIVLPEAKDGKTPEKGVDYFTEEEISDVVDKAAAKVHNASPYKDDDRKLVLLCGVQGIVEKEGSGNKVTYYENGELKSISFDNTYNLVGGGCGLDGTLANYPSTSIIIKDGNLKNVIAGSIGAGNVGTATVVVFAGTLKSLVGSYAWNDATSKNMQNTVGKVKLIVNGGTFTDIYGAVGSGLGGVGSAEIIVNGGNHDYITVAGSNGFTDTAKVVIYGGTINTVQGVNRGTVGNVIHKIYGGTITNLFLGGENVSDVTATYNACYAEILGGTISTVKAGKNGTTTDDATKISGKYVAGVVDDGVAGNLNLTKVDTVKSADLADFVTDEDVDGKLAEYTKTDGLGAVIEAKLTPYAKTEDVESSLAEYTKTEGLGTVIDGKLEGYIKSTEVDEKLNAYTKTEGLGAVIDDKLTPYAKTEAVDPMIDAKLGAYTKTEDLDGVIQTALTDYAKTADVSSTIDSKLEAYTTTEGLSSVLEPYAKTEDLDSTIDSKLMTKLSTYAEKTYVDEAADAKVTEKLTDYSDTAATTSLIEEKLAPYVKSETLTDTLTPYAKKTEITTATDDMATKTEMNTKLADYLKIADLPDQLIDYAKSASVTSQIEEATSDVVKTAALAEYLKIAEIDTTLTAYAKTEAVTAQIQSATEGVAKTADLEAYLKKAEIDENLTDYVKTESLDVYAKTADLDGVYMKKTDMDDYETEAELISALTDYVKKDQLGSYTTTEDLSSTYATKSELESYAKTEALDAYVKTASANDTVKAALSAIDLTLTLDTDNKTLKLKAGETEIASVDLSTLALAGAGA